CKLRPDLEWRSAVVVTGTASGDIKTGIRVWLLTNPETRRAHCLGDDRLLRSGSTGSRSIDISKICGNRLDVGVRELCEPIMHHCGHRARRSAVQGARAASQIAEEICLRPGHRCRVCVRQGGGDPAVDYGTGIGMGRLFCPQKIARRVTGATMAQPLGEIGAAIPFCTLRGIRLIAPIRNEEELPAGLKETDIERERQGVRLCRRPDRRPCHEIRIEGLHVLIRDLREMIERKRRKKMRAIAGDPLHRACKCRLGPAADSRFRIRCDVGRVDDTEWCRHPITAGISRTTLSGMAGSAIACAGERLALGNQLARKTGASGGIDRREADPPGKGEKPHPAKSAQPYETDGYPLEQASLRTFDPRLPIPSFGAAWTPLAAERLRGTRNQAPKEGRTSPHRRKKPRNR